MSARTVYKVGSSVHISLGRPFPLAERKFSRHLPEYSHDFVLGTPGKSRGKQQHIAVMSWEMVRILFEFHLGNSNEECTVGKPLEVFWDYVGISIV